MRPILIFLISLSSLACGRAGEESELRSVAVAKECRPYYKLFREVTGQSASNVSCGFAPENHFAENILGYCSFGAGWDILINSDRWPSLGPGRREALLLHELGHCSLGREHEDSFKEGRPASIMATYLLDEDTYQANRDEYLKELWGGYDY